MPVPSSIAPYFCTIWLRVETAVCMVSSNSVGDLNGLVGFDFHYMQLHFFSKSEVWQLDEVYDFSAVIFDDFVANWQGF